MEERFVEKTDSIDKLTGDKLRGGRQPLPKRGKYNLSLGDAVRQAIQKHSSGCIGIPHKPPRDHSLEQSNSTSGRAGRRCPSGESGQSENAHQRPMNHRPNQQDSSEIPQQEGTGDNLSSGDEVRQVKQKHSLSCIDNLPSGEEVRQVEQNHSFVCFAKMLRCGENIISFSVLQSYFGPNVSCHDIDTRSASTQGEESDIKQCEENTSNFGCNHSLSESLLQHLSSQVAVKQYEEETLMDFVLGQCFFTNAELFLCVEYVSLNMVDPMDASDIQGYIHTKGTIAFLLGLNASRLLLVCQILPLLCLPGDLRRKLKEKKDLDVIYRLDKTHKPLWDHSPEQSNPNIEPLQRKMKNVRDQSGIPYDHPRDHSLKQSNSTNDDMENMSKEGKDKNIKDILGIENKPLRYYSRKQSNSDTGIYKLVSKFLLSDPKGTFENNRSISMESILNILPGDYTRKYGNLFKEARSRVSQVRKQTDLWHGNILASRDKELFPEGSFASNVQKLMKKDLNRLGAGGNGEIVEAFYQKKHLVIKQTLLRELELSVVPKLEHKNLLPWFAIISGEKSERRPGQVSCYQIMQKMTEDLSASIRTIGGSIHDHILSLQQDSVPKAEVSQQAELMRRNTSVVFRNVLEGLQYLHEQGLVHRDIKASNILLKKSESCAHTSIFTCDCTPHWEVKVADFDSIGQISVLRERAAMRGKKKLKSGRGPFLKVSATGTSGYRAPEIFEEFTSSDVNDPQYFSPASDIWALGGVGIHVVMGFCTPRKQYQFGLMMLAHRGMLKGDERDDIISRTLGLHHIREGFPGEKWKDMINFVSRPLQIDWYQRPSAKKLLQDPFIQRYNTTPGLNTVVNETATLDTATPSTIELSTEPQQVENQFINRNDISGPNRPRTGNL